MNSSFRILLMIGLGSCCLSVEGSAKTTKPWYEKLPVVKDLRTKFELFSWARDDGLYRFALIADRGDQGYFFNQFDRQRTPGMFLEELRPRLAKLPSNSLVSWIRYKPDRIDYPSQKIIKKIEKWCADFRVDLAFNEPISE